MIATAAACSSAQNVDQGPLNSKQPTSDKTNENQQQTNDVISFYSQITQNDATKATVNQDQKLPSEVGKTLTSLDAINALLNKDSQITKLKQAENSFEIKIADVNNDDDNGIINIRITVVSGTNFYLPDGKTTTKESDAGVTLKLTGFKKNNVTPTPQEQQEKIISDYYASLPSGQINIQTNANKDAALAVDQINATANTTELINVLQKYLPADNQINSLPNNLNDNNYQLVVNSIQDSPAGHVIVVLWLKNSSNQIVDNTGKNNSDYIGKQFTLAGFDQAPANVSSEVHTITPPASAEQSVAKATLIPLVNGQYQGLSINSSNLSEILKNSTFSAQTFGKSFDGTSAENPIAYDSSLIKFYAQGEDGLSSNKIYAFVLNGDYWKGVGLTVTVDDNGVYVELDEAFYINQNAATKEQIATKTYPTTSDVLHSGFSDPGYATSMDTFGYGIQNLTWNYEIKNQTPAIAPTQPTTNEQQEANAIKLYYSNFQNTTTIKVPQTVTDNVNVVESTIKNATDVSTINQYLPQDHQLSALPKNLTASGYKLSFEKIHADKENGTITFNFVISNKDNVHVDQTGSVNSTYNGKTIKLTGLGSTVFTSQTNGPIAFDLPTKLISLTDGKTANGLEINNSNLVSIFEKSAFSATTVGQFMNNGVSKSYDDGLVNFFAANGGQTDNKIYAWILDDGSYKGVGLTVTVQADGVYVTYNEAFYMSASDTNHDAIKNKTYDPNLIQSQSDHADNPDDPGYGIVNLHWIYSLS
ncbi:hypothetical protein [[Mycoplasma] testudinis]|uniref:hypothetical protein n=1 Tax=[Mycoplasma] testudinis TaxID=33924 RepID=UPI0012EC6F8F|nr:hypothetical protein [[Mycoplasma] testudinis]